MVRTSTSSPFFLRWAVQVCFLTLLQLLSSVHQCSGKISNAEEPSGEVHYNTEQYLLIDKSSYWLPFLLYCPLQIVICTVVYYFSKFCCHSMYTVEIRCAKQHVKRDIAQHPYDCKNIPPMECTYETTYTVPGGSYEDALGETHDEPDKTYHETLTLKFSNQETNDDGDDDIEQNTSRLTESRNRWYISGSYIIEGEVCAATGQAYWVQEFPYNYSTVRYGKFQPPNFESFAGSWCRRNGGRGSYDSFVKKSETTAADSQEP